jgi:hypothetical protein
LVLSEISVVAREKKLIRELKPGTAEANPGTSYKELFLLHPNVLKWVNRKNIIFDPYTHILIEGIKNYMNKD